MRHRPLFDSDDRCREQILEADGREPISRRQTAECGAIRSREFSVTSTRGGPALVLEWSAFPNLQQRCAKKNGRRHNKLPTPPPPTKPFTMKLPLQMMESAAYSFLPPFSPSNACHFCLQLAQVLMKAGAAKPEPSLNLSPRYERNAPRATSESRYARYAVQTVDPAGCAQDKYQ